MTEKLNIRIGTLNSRGLRNRDKRNALLRQATTHCDIILLQDTHLNISDINSVSKEWQQFNWYSSPGLTNSRGVAIAFRKKIKHEVLDIDSDTDGRLCGIGVKMWTKKFYLLSAYAPCCDSTASTRNSNLQFLQLLAAKMVEKRALGYDVIAGGDLNFIRDEELDAAGGHPKVYNAQANWIANLENNCNFHDTQRFFNPDRRITTWSPTGQNIRGLHRRLDYILASMECLEKTTEVKVIRVPRSDHGLLISTICPKSEKITGPGVWRHNDTLLKDDEYVNAIEKCIDVLLVEKQVGDDGMSFDPQMTWEWMKYKVRETAREFGKRRAKERTTERIHLEGLLSRQIEQNHPEVEETRERLARHYNELDEVIRFRSMVEQVEHHEKLSPYFFKQIAANRQQSNVEKIKTTDHPQGTTNREQTMTALHNHYQKLFQEPIPNRRIEQSWWGTVPRLEDELKEDLDRPITLNDITTELFNKMSPSKAPGNDGLTVLFYRKFWHLLARPLHQSLIKSWSKGELSASQKQSIIRLIQKKGKDPENIEGWRPISLVNTDYKIYAKAITTRLRRACKKLVAEDQLAFVEGRHIHEGHLYINRALELARLKRIHGYVLCVDFKAAFDSVSHQFLWKSLEKMNIGPQLIQHLKTLYRNSESAILNYGTQTQYFKLERSCRQGDPVSPYLFVLALEVLLCKLKAKTRPLKYQQFEIHYTAYADDLTLFLPTRMDLDIARNIIKEFGGASGLGININKSELLCLGDKIDRYDVPIKDEIKVTGKIFSLNSKSAAKRNWDEAIISIKRKFESWEGRHLTLIGKSLILKAQILPLVIFPGTTVTMTKKTEIELVRLCSNFLWGGSDKATRALCQKRHSEGGLEIPNFRARLMAIHAGWIFRAVESGNVRRAFMEGDTNVNVLKKPISETCLRDTCINAWYRLKSLTPFGEEEELWPLVEGPMRPMLKQSRLTKGALMLENLEGLTWMHRLSIRSAKSQIIKTAEATWQERRTESRNHIATAYRGPKWKNKMIPGSSARAQETMLEERHNDHITTYKKQKQRYWLAVDQVITPVLNFRQQFDNMDWEKVDKEKIFTHSKYRAFMWKSSHGKLYGNKDFVRFGLKDDEKCELCNEPRQTFVHLMTECSKTQCLFANLEVHLKLEDKWTDKEKLIGMDPEKKRSKGQLKKLNILRKVIYDCNREEVTPKWEKYLTNAETIYTMEYVISDKNDTVFKCLQSWDM